MDSQTEADIRQNIFEATSETIEEMKSEAGSMSKDLDKVRALGIVAVAVARVEGVIVETIERIRRETELSKLEQKGRSKGSKRA